MPRPSTYLGQTQWWSSSWLAGVAGCESSWRGEGSAAGSGCCEGAVVKRSAKCKLRQSCSCRRCSLSRAQEKVWPAPPLVPGSKPEEGSLSDWLCRASTCCPESKRVVVGVGGGGGVILSRGATCEPWRRSMT